MKECLYASFPCMLSDLNATMGEKKKKKKKVFWLHHALTSQMSSALCLVLEYHREILFVVLGGLFLVPHLAAMLPVSISFACQEVANSMYSFC